MRFRPGQMVSKRKFQGTGKPGAGFSREDRPRGKALDTARRHLWWHSGLLWNLLFTKDTVSDATLRRAR